MDLPKNGSIGGSSEGLFDSPESIRNDFPIFNGESELHFLDSGASAQKPQEVIDTINFYLQSCYANVHRGTYRLSDEMTNAYESAREGLAKFLGADSDEIVWQSNATSAINLVARSYASRVMGRGKAVLISEMEHHANIVPWQMWAEENSGELRVVKIDDLGELDLESYRGCLDDGKVGLVSITHVSNVLGTVNPIKELIGMAHESEAKVLVDGSQAAVHLRVDVKELDCDFYVCTGHKLYGPTGIGVLYGKREILEEMPPIIGGGDMIERVSFSGTTYANPPARFEAGTPPIVEAIALKKATEWIDRKGWQTLSKNEEEISNYLKQGLQSIKQIEIYGNSRNKLGIWSFNIEGIHHHDISMMLDDLVNVSVRSGHHCAQPLMERMGVKGMVRASIAAYNVGGDIDKLIEGLDRILKISGVKS